jgi:dTDP-4-dehydrorhamnose reductase
MKKILLIGGTGQVGGELQRSLMPLGHVINVGRTATNLSIDLAKPDNIRAIMREIKPDIIINPAAYTAVDKAESEVELAMAINGTAPGILAEEANRLQALLVHYSTDFVFDGMSHKPYLETDIPNPINIYGKSKLAGELAIQAISKQYLIFRTSWVYGLRGNNFLLTMLKLAKEQSEIKVVNDQVGSPTWSRAIAEITTQILAQGIVDFQDFFAQKSGLYHLTTAGQTTWYDFATSIFTLDATGQKNILPNVIPISSDQYVTAAKRPPYSVLDNAKLLDQFSLKLPAWDECLNLCFQDRY